MQEAVQGAGGWAGCRPASGLSRPFTDLKQLCGRLDMSSSHHLIISSSHHVIMS